MVSSAYQGFCPFRRYNRLVHWGGYLSGVGVWIVGYLLAGFALPNLGLVSVAIATIVACVLTGIYMGVLYGYAIGSPWANVLFPMGLPLLGPELLYTYPFSGTSMPAELGGVAVTSAGMIAGTIASLRSIQRVYAGMDDPLVWELDVMPHSVRVVDAEWLAAQPPYDREYVTEYPKLDPRAETPIGIRLDVRGWLYGVPFAAVAIALGAYGSATYGSRGFDAIILLAMCVMLHWALQCETAESAP